MGGILFIVALIIMSNWFKTTNLRQETLKFIKQQTQSSDSVRPIKTTYFQ